ncbi:MAG: hypothetical protein JXK05_12855 [Campylobacterales bacterium]|nr:hypothetical protein [Campylobacterales bacterium]
MKPILLLLLTLQVWATEPTIDAQIEALADAPPQERFEMMNAIKARIAGMNAKEREVALSTLRQGHPNGSALMLHRGANGSGEQLQKGKNPSAPQGQKPGISGPKH